MQFKPTKSDCFGLIRPAVDAHTLGISAVKQLLSECGYRSVVADAATCEAFSRPEQIDSIPIVDRWIRQNRLTVLGFSNRLDPPG